MIQYTNGVRGILKKINQLNKHLNWSCSRNVGEFQTSVKNVYSAARNCPEENFRLK